MNYEFWHMSRLRTTSKYLAEWNNEEMADALESVFCSADEGHRHGGSRLSDLSLILPDTEVQDFVWTWQSECLVTENTLEWLHANGFTGFEVKPVRAKFRKSKKSPPVLWELIVTGWAGLAKAESGIGLDESRSCRVCGYLRYTGLESPRELIDPNRWDGSDFFMVWPLPRFIFISDRLAQAILERDLVGVQVRPVPEIGRMDGFAPGRLHYYMPDDRSHQLGDPLGIY
jgi:hypothetical protein